MTHNPNHPAGGAGAVKALALSEVPAEVVVAMGAYLNLNYPEAGLDDDDLAAMFREGYNALSPTPVPEPTAADMRAFGASAVAAYKWPGDTPEHRAARAAYCEGAASVVPERNDGGQRVIDGLNDVLAYCDGDTSAVSLISRPPSSEAEIAGLMAERDALRGVLSGLSSFLGAGLGDDATTAEQFDRRIREGIETTYAPMVEAWQRSISEGK